MYYPLKLDSFTYFFNQIAKDALSLIFSSLINVISSPIVLTKAISDPDPAAAKRVRSDNADEKDRHR
jgi:hypothetical protein